MGRKGENKAKRYIVEDVPLELIDVTEQLIRDIPADDDIGELQESIQSVDLLQFPGVIRAEAGRFKLAWGRRRLEAFRRMGETSIPCRIYEGEMKEIKALALIENNQRKQNSIKEECDCVTYLNIEKNMSPDQVANALGRTRSWVLTRLAIPNFPPDCREALIAGAIPLGHAETIAAVEDDGQRAYILNQTIYQKLPLSEVKQLCAIAERTPDMSQAVEAGVAAAAAVAAPQAVMMACAHCNRPDTLNNLSVIRVHPYQCWEDPQPAADGQYPQATEQ